MNKAQFVDLVQEKGDFATKADAIQAIDAFTGAISTALAKGEDVSLIGFGSFNTVLQKSKSGTVPGTDKQYTTEEKMVPKFKAGKILKDRVAAGK